MPYHNHGDLSSIIVFRLDSEWFALKTECLKEISHLKIIHQIPHRTNRFLKGLVNINGQLQVCISLHALFELNPSVDKLQLPENEQKRLIVIAKNEDIWIFLADEIDGIYSWNLSEFEKEPENENQNSSVYLKGSLQKLNRKVSLVDEELLFYRLSHHSMM